MDVAAMFQPPTTRIMLHVAFFHRPIATSKIGTVHTGLVLKSKMGDGGSGWEPGTKKWPEGSQSGASKPLRVQFYM